MFGEGNGNPLLYSCLENPMDRGAWQATVHGVTRVGHDLVTEERERERCWCQPKFWPVFWISSQIFERCPVFYLFYLLWESFFWRFWGAPVWIWFSCKLESWLYFQDLPSAIILFLVLQCLRTACPQVSQERMKDSCDCSGAYVLKVIILACLIERQSKCPLGWCKAPLALGSLMGEEA